MRPTYTLEDHGADVRVAIVAGTLRGVLEAAADFVLEAGTHGEGTAPSSGITAPDRQHVELDAPSPDLLLLDWINELIAQGEISGCGWRPAELSVRSGPWGCRCVAELEAVRAAWRYKLKAATLHDLRCARTGRRWDATVVCDL